MSYDGIDPTKKPRLPKLFCNPTAAKNLREMNRIIAADISDQTDFKDLHAMIYAGAFAVLKLNDQRPTDVTSRKGTKRQPAWERRLSKNIDNIRSDIAILTQYQKPTYSQRVKKKGDTIMRRYTSEENPTIVEVLDLLKQRLLALSQRVKRYKKSSQRRKQNILFHRNQRAFYKSVGKESDRTLQGKTSFPNTEDIRHFWSDNESMIFAMPKHKLFIGDSGYPCLQYCLTPFQDRVSAERAGEKSYHEPELASQGWLRRLVVLAPTVFTSLRCRISFDYLASGDVAKSVSKYVCPSHLFIPVTIFSMNDRMVTTSSSITILQEKSDWHLVECIKQGDSRKMDSIRVFK
ncbi:unnamed protein product [Acanthoscelides obtectus]|uniref:Uncharacterized protein n=1 Tax=Acanthoscelides obtectus TaxID=200917 RepID=A0A9P0PGW1_ACAOB|nr:unnamed protein product [Acanthoscelides obtectus]CAK1643179.1 hypothetical protein AOBTE_LOCUS13435 [Acanthoscelides obtectus]